jgi:hypothetical protein
MKVASIGWRLAEVVGQSSSSAAASSSSQKNYKKIHSSNKTPLSVFMCLYMLHPVCILVSTVYKLYMGTAHPVCILVTNSNYRRSLLGAAQIQIIVVVCLSQKLHSTIGCDRPEKKTEEKMTILQLVGRFRSRFWFHFLFILTFHSSSIVIILTS